MSSARTFLAGVTLGVGAFAADVAHAQTSPDAGADPGAAPTSAAATSAAPPAATTSGGSVGGCVETIPKGAQRPTVTETFPERGTSGWAATLAITIRHGRGERVLPSGLDLSSAADAKKYLKQAGFVVPAQEGGAGARVFSDPEKPNETTTTTHLELPLVTLPDKPGRNVLHLPPLPVAIARSNGEIATVCTHPHTIVVEDPIANVPEAMPKANPSPRPQREEWTALKKAVTWGGLGIVVGAILAYLLYRYLSRPKPVPPPPPPRPPWEVALERLDDVRHAGLLETARYTEYFDRVNDAVRSYFGARFGFDGLESTTDEILAALRKQAGGIVRMHRDGAASQTWEGAVTHDEIAAFLAECDLVKFANLTPTPEQCAAAIAAGERFIRKTSPLEGLPVSVVTAPAVDGAVAPTNVSASAKAPAVDEDAQWKPPAGSDAAGSDAAGNDAAGSDVASSDAAGDDEGGRS